MLLRDTSRSLFSALPFYSVEFDLALVGRSEHITVSITYMSRRRWEEMATHSTVPSSPEKYYDASAHLGNVRYLYAQFKPEQNREFHRRADIDGLLPSDVASVIPQAFALRVIAHFAHCKCLLKSPNSLCISVCPTLQARQKHRHLLSSPTYSH
jgi:hypothetical protein